VAEPAGGSLAGEKTIYVSRKADVAVLDRFIGPQGVTRLDSGGAGPELGLSASVISRGVA
jgi:hypothetical protein